MSPFAAAFLWKSTTLAMGIASFFLLAAAVVAAFTGATRRALLLAAAAKLFVYSAWMLTHDAFVYVILEYGSTLILLLVLLGANRIRGEAGHRAYLAGGILISIAAAAIQQSGIRLHSALQSQRLDARRANGRGLAALSGRPPSPGCRQEDMMALDRRTFLKTAGGLMAWPRTGSGLRRSGAGVLVNDIHSQLNPTRVHEIVPVDSLRALQRAIRRASGEGRAVCIAGGRHAMGAQQFAEGAMMLDTTKHNRVRSFDRAKRHRRGRCRHHVAGADRLSAQGSGGPPPPVGHRSEADRRGQADDRRSACRQRARPRSQDEAVHRRRRVVRARSTRRARRAPAAAPRTRSCFASPSAATVSSAPSPRVKLRLIPRQKIQRVVEVRTIDDLPTAFEQRIAEGFMFGDFQFSVDETSDDFLRKGVFSCYRPVDPAHADARRAAGAG